MKNSAYDLNKNATLKRSVILIVSLNEKTRQITLDFL